MKVKVNEAALVRSICRESFFAFVREFWGVVVPEKPVWNWHIKYLCDLFQQDAERVFRGELKQYDTIVNIPPGTTKSTVLSIMAPAWAHAMCPSMRVLAASHTAQLTYDLGRKCRMVEESAMYRAAFPEVVSSKDQWTKSLFMNTAGGGRIASTVGGKIPTGFHAHFIIVDDPLDPQQASRASEAEIAVANSFMSEALPTRKVDKAITVTWLIMQRLHQNDPTGFLLSKAKENIRHICLPAERSSKVSPVSLRKYYSKDGLLDPVRLPKHILKELKIDLGEYGYAAQCDQCPVPRGGGMFKVDRISMGTPPIMTDKHWIGLCRFWDKAGTAGGGAYTVGFLMGRLRPEGAPHDGSEDKWWILDVVREQLDSGDREKLIKAIAEQDGRRVIVGVEQEPGSGGKESAQATAKRLAGYRVRIVPSVGSKQERADEWSTQVNAGAFQMREAPWNQGLIDELRYFPYSKYKDQADAGAGAFTVLTKWSKRVGAAFSSGTRYGLR